MAMATNSGQLPKNPNMPTPTQYAPQKQARPVDVSKPAPAVNHPAVENYIAEWNRMARENDALKVENQQLKYDLDCARQMINELQHISDHERAKKETFQRWAVKFDTMAGEVASLATHMRDEAARAAQPEPVAQQIEADVEPEPVLPVEELQKVDKDIAAFAKKFAPRSNGDHK